MQEYKRQIDRESQGLRGFFVLDSRGMLHYYRRQFRKLSTYTLQMKHIVLIVQMGVTKCMCLGRPLTPSGNQAWYIIYFLSSW
ncbi:hypothetical protein P8452_30412 [Trifolium repens]|nr:hypothetical protein P8452_30412 [Trifolium repens]